MDRLQDTLLALGHGLAFVGRQVRFDVDGDELVLDLLLFHVEQLRYVVIELKIGRFESGYVGQLGTYVALVDDRLRRADRHAPTVGILLCTSRNEQVVRYALSASTAPMAVPATPTTRSQRTSRRRCPPRRSLPRRSSCRATKSCRTWHDGPGRGARSPHLTRDESQC